MITTVELAVRSLTKENKRIEIGLGKEDYHALRTSMRKDVLIRDVSASESGVCTYNIAGTRVTLKRI